MITVATTRGVTSFFIGSVPSARMASICSVTIMEPSSLAIPDEFRPPPPVRRAPAEFRTMPIETSWPMTVVAPKRDSVVALLSAKAAPVKNTALRTIGNEPNPTRSACCSISAT